MIACDLRGGYFFANSTGLAICLIQLSLLHIHLTLLYAERLGSIRTRLYTDETEEMGYIPFPPQRLPTYPPANTTTSLTATPRHISSASGQQYSVTTTSSEDSEVFSVVYGAEHSSRSLAVTPFSTRESPRDEHQRNPPLRPQTPTPYSEHWSGGPDSIEDDCQLKQSVYYRPPTPYSTRGSDHDELEDTEWQQDNTQIPCRPQTPTAYTDPNSSKVGGTSYPESSTERTRHRSGRPCREIKRTPSEMKEVSVCCVCIFLVRNQPIVNYTKFRDTHLADI